MMTKKDQPFSNAALFEAAKKGDLAHVKRALKDGQKSMRAMCYLKHR